MFKPTYNCNYITDKYYHVIEIQVPNKKSIIVKLIFIFYYVNKYVSYIELMEIENKMKIVLGNPERVLIGSEVINL